MTQIFSFLFQKAQEIAPVWVIYICCAIFLIWVTAVATIKINNHIRKVNNVCTDNSSNKSELNSIKEKLSLLLDKFNSLIAVLHENGAIKDDVKFIVRSPINLTQDGRNFLDKIGWNNIINNQANKDLVFSALDKLNLKTKADVQKYSFIILLEFFDSRENNFMLPIKDYLYNNPNEQKGNTLFACSLDLRDKYLSSHTEIN